MSTHEENPIDQAISHAYTAELYSEHSHNLRLFLIGVLRDHQLADDVLQTTFVKLAEKNDDLSSTSAASVKSWLFKVAFNEAIAVRRREKIGDKVLHRVAWTATKSNEAADVQLVRTENIEAVRTAISELPGDLQQIVQMRIHDEKTFASISDELNIPLGTALGRMRSAIKRLHQKLKDE